MFCCFAQLRFSIAAYFSSCLYKLANRENNFLTNIQPLLCKIHNKLTVFRNNIFPLDVIYNYNRFNFALLTYIFLALLLQIQDIAFSTERKNGHKLNCNHWKKSSKLLMFILFVLKLDTIIT